MLSVPGFTDLLMTFPTVLFVALSVVSLIYWVLVIAGAADLDALDGLVGHADGAVDSAVDAVAGAAKGGGSILGDALAALGLTKVPVTISASIFGMVGFFVSLSTHHLIGALLPGVLTSLIALVLSVVVATLSTSLLTRPLAALFVDSTSTRTGGDTHLGRTVVITIDADERSGQARTDDEGIVSVRCKSGVLARGAEAVIMDKDRDGVFVVEPVHAVLPSTADAFARLATEQAQADAEVPASVVSPKR